MKLLLLVVEVTLWPQIKKGLVITKPFCLYQNNTN